MKTQVIKAEELFSEDPIEKCVICGKETNYRRSTPISKREGYIECAGQLCPACYKRLYLNSSSN